MDGKAEMERFLLERRRSQKTSLQRILRVSNDNVLCKLKFRHHQTRGALLFGTKPQEVVEEEEKENEVDPHKLSVTGTSPINKVSSIERAERRRERQAGLARLVSKLRQAENAVLRDSIWELVSITREHEQKMPNGEKAFVTKEILRLRNVSSCDQPTFLLFPKPLNCRETGAMEESAITSEHSDGSRKTSRDSGFLGPALLFPMPEILAHPESCPGGRAHMDSLTSTGESVDGETDWEYVEGEEEEEGDDWEYEVVEEEPEVPRREVQGPYCSKAVAWPVSPNTEQAAEIFKSWVALMRNRESKILVSLLEEHGVGEGIGGKRNLQEPNLNPSVVKYKGKMDKQGKYHGDGEAWYSNGALFLGTFHHGVREGPGSLQVMVAGEEHVTEGTFCQDKLEGWAEETFNGTGWRQVYYRRGQQVGYYREFSPDGSEIEWGVIGGPVWKIMAGNCLLVGDSYDGGKISGDMTYLYPGFTIGIVGQYQGGHLRAGREAVLTGVKYGSHGLPVPVLTTVRGSRLLEYEQPGSVTPAKHCQLRDLWDLLHVYVAPSQASDVAGEGLYVRRKVPSGGLVCCFNGVRDRIYAGLFRASAGQSVIAQQGLGSDYMICCDPMYNLDIPDHYTSTANYAATLAHKACHSFTPNSSFINLYHPRFGKIMSIVALRDLHPGEEILVCYNYKLDKAPQWYQNNWIQHLMKDRGWSREDATTYGIKAATSHTLYASLEKKNREDRGRD